MDDLTPFELPSGRRPEDLLAATRARGGRIRARRRAAFASAAIVAVVLVAVPLTSAALSGPPRTTRVATPAGNTTTTTGDDTTTTAAPPPTTSSTTAPSTTTTTTKASTTTTTLACRNSYNPACGPFRWDPAPPPADPVSMTITYSPAHPKAGDTVTFTVQHHDPNDTIWDCGREDFGDHSPDPCPQVERVPCPTRYGPWDPPAKKPDDTATTATHTYNTAGTYSVRFTYETYPYCYNPYYTTVTATTTITIG